MNILWIKDGKLGHEKQVEALLREIKISQNVNIQEIAIDKIKNDALEWLTFGLFKSNLNKIHDFDFDLIIGAGSNTHLKMVNLKRKYKKVKIVSILCPNIIFRKSFDFICLPFHDSNKKISKSKSIYFEGSLSSVYDGSVEESLGMFSIGGKNKHYEFNEDYILEQIRFLSSIYPYKIWHIFNSRRTPDSMNNKIYNLIKDFKNLNFEDINNSESKNIYKDILKSSSIRVITRDSVSMVYESLSSSGKSFLFDMDAKQSNKIVKNISMLINERRIGSLDKNLMADGLYKLQLRPQNKHFDVLREVEKLAYTILKRLKKL